MKTGMRQLLSLSAMSTRTIHARWSSSAVAIAGFAVTAAVLVAVLALADGLASLWNVPASDDIAIVMARNAFAEEGSRLPATAADELRQAPGVDRAGATSISPQLLATTTLPRVSDGAAVNAPVRGFVGQPPAWFARMTVDEGRGYAPGKNEVIVGRRLAESLGLRVGGQVVLGNAAFVVVGRFTDGGSIHESEIWGDATQIGAAMGEPGQVSSIYARLSHPEGFGSFAAYVGASRTLDADVSRQSDYLRRQADRYRRVVLVPGIAIVALMALAAMLAAFNTMQSAVQARLRELATLRAIGFGAAVVSAHLISEAALLGCVGACVGACAAAVLLHGASAMTSNGLSAMAFTFSTAPASTAEAIGCVLLAAVLAGMWPAVALSRACIADALRKT